MTLKTFRDAYLATRYLARHEPACTTCQNHNVWGDPPCARAIVANTAIDKANRMLGLTGDAQVSPSLTVYHHLTKEKA